MTEDPVSNVNNCMEQKWLQIWNKMSGVNNIFRTNWKLYDINPPKIPLPGDAQNFWLLLQKLDLYLPIWHMAQALLKTLIISSRTAH